MITTAAAETLRRFDSMQLCTLTRAYSLGLETYLFIAMVQKFMFIIIVGDVGERDRGIIRLFTFHTNKKNCNEILIYVPT